MMNHDTLPHIVSEESERNISSAVTADTYDEATVDGGWDSPERAQRLVGMYINKDTLVLDIGTGTGQAAKGYMDKGAMVVALDRDPEMLTQARETIGDKGVYRTADINTKLPVEDINGLVDVAQAIGVLEFAEDLSGVMDQVKTVLTPDGKFVFTVEEIEPGGEQSEYFADVDVTTHRYSPQAVKALLDEKGFDVLEDEAYGGYDRGGDKKVPYHIYLTQKSQ